MKGPRKIAGVVAGLIVGLGVGAAVVPALAEQAPVLTPDQQSQLQGEVDAFRACLQEHGVTPPTRPADTGVKPNPPTAEEREARKAAFDACQSLRPNRPELTDAQKAQLQAQQQQYRECLAQNGVTLPTPPAPSADGTPPSRPADGQRPVITDEQRAAMRQAHEACADLRPNLGVEGLGGPGGPGGPHGPGGLRGPGGPLR